MTTSFLLVALFLQSAPPASSSALSGTWTIHSMIAGNPSDSVCTMVQSDVKLTGTCKFSDAKDGKEAKSLKARGSVRGNIVSWTIESELNGAPLTLTYSSSGAPTDGKFSGKVAVDPFGVEGDFTASIQQ